MTHIRRFSGYGHVITMHKAGAKWIVEHNGREVIRCRSRVSAVRLYELCKVRVLLDALGTHCT